MFKLIQRMGVCVLMLGLQGALNFTVSVEPVNDDWKQPNQLSWRAQDWESSVR